MVMGEEEHTDSLPRATEKVKVKCPGGKASVGEAEDSGRKEDGEASVSCSPPRAFPVSGRWEQGQQLCAKRRATAGCWGRLGILLQAFGNSQDQASCRIPEGMSWELSLRADIIFCQL